MREPSGCLIAFEGPEGAGKSTQIRLVAESLQRDGRTVDITAEPGGTRLGEELRRLLLHEQSAAPNPLAELFLMLADRAQHVRDVIQPALAAGTVVLTDRFSGSTLAYQGYGRGLDLESVRAADAFARQGVTPRATVLLDCPVHIGLERARGSDRFHGEARAFHERVRLGFLALAAAAPDTWHIVDSTQPAPVVQAQVMSIVRRCVERP